MKLASYVGTRSGIMGLGNVLIRLRLRGRCSHSEVVFEPGDGVDEYMPDGTCRPDESGALWCASSTGLERVPPWSPRRPGRRGGVRFKRISLSGKWVLDDAQACPRQVAQWAKDSQGRLYDWQLILGFLSWLVPNKRSRVMCSEFCAEALGFDEAWRFDPCTLRSAVKRGGSSRAPQSPVQPQERP